MQKKNFDPASPGFLYTIITSVLTLLAIAGIEFPKAVTTIAGELTTSLSSGGVYAIIGVLIASVIFPIINFIKSGKTFSFSSFFGSTLTWVAIGNAVLAVIALSGFTLPDGTVEQIVGAIAAKDWMGLISMLALTVGTTLIRWIKDRQTPPLVVTGTMPGDKWNT